QVPPGALLDRLDEQRPAVLEVRDHDHGDERGTELEPAVVDVHRTASSVCGWARCVRCSSSSFAHAYMARVAGIATSSRSPSSTDRKSTRLNSSHVAISYAVFCLKKKK